jgi:uncharacterized membrane protein (UPF0127 family)
MRVLHAIVASQTIAACAGCQRTPQEDFVRTAETERPTVAVVDASRAPSSGSEGSTHALDDLPSGRCLKLTPSEPPPPVAAGPAAGCPADPEGSTGKLPHVRVTFSDASGASVDAEMVRSEHDTMRGLMYRKSLLEDRGMLFDLRVRDDHKFWMHNTCIPLDLLFIDEDGFLVGIVENAPTLDDTSRGVGCPSRWVLEVNAGWARRHGVKAGQ